MALVIDDFARPRGGGPAGRPMPGLFSMPWKKPFISANPDQGWCDHADRHTCPLATPSDGPKRGSNLPSAASATAATMPGPRRSTACSGLRLFTVVAQAQFQCRGIRTLGMGGLVQQSPPSRTHRKRPAGGSRGRLLRSSRKIKQGRATKTNQPQAKPERFTRRTGMESVEPSTNSTAKLRRCSEN